MSIMNKLKKNSKVKDSNILSESKFFEEKDFISTPCPMINVALTGRLDGGIFPGFTEIAGPSKHFKTSFALFLASTFLSKHEDAVLLFYDTEFGSPQSYFESFGIDIDRVFHVPVNDIEELKIDMVSQLQELDKKDKVIIIIDSIGNAASRKEVEDAQNEKVVADMSRAKALKSLFRIITPHLTKKEIPLLGINHTYKEIGLFPKDIVGGGTGAYYAANNIWIVGRQQDKKGTDLRGFHFIIKVEKSRFVKEGSKIPISVSFDGGIQIYSGLLDVSIAGGFVVKHSKGKYIRVNRETGEPIGKEVSEAKTLESDFWTELLDDKDFYDFVKNHYSIGLPMSMSMDFIKMEGEEVDDEGK